ncbi:MAG: Ig-like domain-containing protein, partial [Dehalococcoidales bacterium]|nr:Ig-like domain-containing protein [Dehalococcoidales bacterium]
TDTGSSPGTLPGYGPNTRTIMQIRVTNTAPAQPFDLTALNEAFVPSDHSPGVFAQDQSPIIVGQTAYNEIYNTTFPNTWPNWGISRIQDNSLSFKTVNGNTVTLPMQPKAIQDEMGEAFDMYGRMSGFLGVEIPFTAAGNQNFVLYGFASPPVDVIESSITGTQIGELDDGTQIWKITHNGVDTHPIHFHMFEVQLINRVGWDGAIRLPDPNELGWKETIRVSPLEDTIVALRPIVPELPFQVPNSVRLIDPTLPEGVPLPGGPGGFKDPQAQPVTVTNHYVNFGWEYVWHCHILSHEEMDMMHAIALAVRPIAPTNLMIDNNQPGITLVWDDNSINETGFTIQRAEDINFTTGLTTFRVEADVTTYTDLSAMDNQIYYYRVFATNTVGDTTIYAAPSAGFPTITANSDFSNVVMANGITLQQTRLTITASNVFSPGDPVNVSATLYELPALTQIQTADLSVTFNYVIYDLEAGTSTPGSTTINTDPNGIATLPLNAPMAKSIILVDAVFNGSGSWLASSSMKIISVLPIVEATITASSNLGDVTFNLADQYGNPIPSQNLSFLTTSGSLSASSGITDTNGNVTVTLTNAPSAVVSASFGGYISPQGWAYQPAMTRITVNTTATTDIQTRLVTTAPNVFSPGDPVNVSATLYEL